MTTTSPGWVRPVNPTRTDKARIEGTIDSIQKSAREYEAAGKANAALIAQAHADEWKKRLATM